MDEERRGKVRMSNGEGWDGRKEGTVMELLWSGNLGTKQTLHIGLCGMGLIGSPRLGLLKGDSVC